MGQSGPGPMTPMAYCDQNFVRSYRQNNQNLIFHAH